MTAAPAGRLGDERERHTDYDRILASSIIGGAMALPTANEPWRVVDTGVAEASVSSGIPGLRFLMKGAAVVLITSVAPALGVGTSVAGAPSRVPGDASRAPVPSVYVVPGRRREDNNTGADTPAPSTGMSVAATAGDQVSVVQSALGLSVTEVAAVVGVTRATVHAWLRGDVAVPNRPETKQRLHDLYDLARTWAGNSEGPLGALARAAIMPDGASLLSLLTAAAWDAGSVRAAFGLLRSVVASATEAQARQNSMAVGAAEATDEEVASAERVRNRRALQQARALRLRG